jgi:ligand-binding sensor domain-containing protein
MDCPSLPTRRTVFPFSLLLLFLCFFFMAKPGFSLNPDSHISQYGHTAWRIQDGYFGGKVRKITQTTDGYIWIGTEAGLFRFDGVRFVPWSSLTAEPLSSAYIIALRAARDGSLWIGTDDGLAHWVDQQLITYLKGDYVPDIFEDEKGEIWVARNKAGDPSDPLCHVVDQAIRCFGSDDGVPPFDAKPLAQDSSGNLWVGGDTKLLSWRLGPSRAWLGPSRIYSPKALQSGAGTGGGVRALAVAADGSLWVGMQLAGQGGLQHIVDGALKSFDAPGLSGETLGVNALLNDRQNSLWVGTTSQGIYRIRGKDVDHFRSTDGLSSDSVWTFFEDREGNLWVATSQGLDMFRDLRVRSFSAREGLSEDSVNSVLVSRDGTVWVGTAGDLQVLGPNGVASLPGKAWQGKQVASMFEDRAGRLWVGMDNALSIYQHGQFRQIHKQDGSPVGLVMSMTEDSENNIWVETFGPPGTLIRIQDLRVREEFPAPQVPLAQRLAADPQSGIWLGLANGSLARYRSGKIETFPFTGHSMSRVRAIFAASDGSILGATASGVLGWKNGRQQILTVRNGLPCDTLNALIQDNQDNLWLHGQCGLIEIPNDEMRLWWDQPERRLKLKVFDASDGAGAGEGHFSKSARSPDGRLWFATRGVLQMVDPAHMAGNAVAPPVYIDALVADRKRYSPHEGPRFLLELVISRLTTPPSASLCRKRCSFATGSKATIRPGRNLERGARLFTMISRQVRTAFA